MDIIRTLRLTDIQLPVIVEHAHMNLPESESAGIPSERVDMLTLDIAIDYRGGALRAGSHDGVFNFMTLYNRLCLGPVRTLRGPLETVLDEILALAEREAAQNQLQLLHLTASANRIGLVVGAPELRVERIYEALPQLSSGSYRSAGITRVPLQLKVDHRWSKDVEYGGHANPRPEVAELRFAAVTPAQPIADDSLAGLYNYLKTYHVAYALQDMLIDGPFERLAEQIAMHVIEDSRALRTRMLSVAIKRSGYARCTPIMGVNIWLDETSIRKV